MPSPTTTLNALLAALNTPGALNYHNPVGFVPATFGNDPSGNPPKVGLAQGPKFNGVVPIETMFAQLFTFLPNFQLNPIGNWLYDPSNVNPARIGMEATIMGQQTGSWFQRATSVVFYSPPISDLIPPPAGTPGQIINQEAFAVFSFFNNKIYQAGVYFDRYFMATTLGNGRTSLRTVIEP
jgi:hypothetical protein